MLEQEYKIMLTAAQYEAICAMYDWDEREEQVNSYYDSPEMTYSKRHFTVRVRTIAGKFLLQMKLPANEAVSGAVTRIELEKELDGVPQTLSGAELSELSGVERLPDARLLGTLTTFRSVKRLPGAEIDLDKSSYFGKTDHELEIEFTDEAAARDILAEISAHTDIDRSSPATGKIRRFLAEYENQK